MMLACSFVLFGFFGGFLVGEKKNRREERERKRENKIVGAEKEYELGRERK